jgi:hypothetical protein
MTHAKKSQSPIHWHAVSEAAKHLAVTPSALRKQLERNAVKARDGGVEAEFDGVRARKLGRLWRVSLGPMWTG